MTKKLNKSEKALNIVKKFDDGRAAGDLVARIMKACKLQMPAARTYLYNARKTIEKMETEVTVTVARKQKLQVVEGTIDSDKAAAA